MRKLNNFFSPFERRKACFRHKGIGLMGWSKSLLVLTIMCVCMCVWVLGIVFLKKKGQDEKEIRWKNTTLSESRERITNSRRLTIKVWLQSLFWRIRNVNLKGFHSWSTRFLHDLVIEIAKSLDRNYANSFALLWALGRSEFRSELFFKLRHKTETICRDAWAKN